MQMKPMRMALRTSAGYGLFAALWILLSDRALVALVSDPHTIGRLSIYKGWAFVAVTGLLLYGTLRTQFQRWQQEVSARARVEESLRTSQLRLSEAMDMARLAYWEADGTTGVFTFNDAFYDLIGTTADREGGYTMAVDQYFRKFAHPDDLSMVHHFAEGLRSSDSHRFDDLDARIIRTDGEVRHILTRLRVLRGPAGQNTKIFGINQDITDRKKTEEALKESEGRFRGAFEASATGMALVGLDGRMLKVNQSLCESVGYSENEFLTKTFRDVTHPDDLEKDREHVRRLIRDEIPHYHIEKRYFHRDGYLLWVLLSVSMVRDARGYPLYFVCQIEDITERKLLEEKLRAALITDELTGLYNRRGFFERSDEALWSAPRRGEIALLFLVKLDDMKRINDTVGHKAGDAVITDVGRMLQETFREKGVIGRIGGVEFAVLATGTEKTVNHLIAHVEDAASTFEKSDGRTCSASLSVGTALSRPNEARSLEELIARANETMMGEKQGKSPRALAGIS